MLVITRNTPPPSEGVRLSEPNTFAFLQTKELGKGTIYIAESCLSWIGEQGDGFSLYYPSISLHAISKDLNSFPEECLYMMVSETLGDDEPSGTESDNEDCDKSSEVRFVPDDKSKLDDMFKAMSICQTLHPSEPFSSEDEEGCYDDAEGDDGEYDLSAAESTAYPVDSNDDTVVCRNGQDEEQPMDVGQFDDAEPEL